MSPKLNIVILNWNGYSDTSELLNSLIKVRSTEFSIIVVDNNSVGNDVEKLESNYKGFIKVLRCNDNLGFAGGNNIGIKQALEDRAEYILLLNNDTIVEPNFLEPLLERINTTEQIGIVAPQINYYDEPKKIWSAGGKISKLRGSGFADSNKLESQVNILDKEVEFVSGCCILIKKDVIENVGLLDENYFLYTEDTDFCFRVRKAGYKIYVTPRSKIYHKVNRSTENKFSTLPLYYTTRNRLYFAKKNFNGLFPVTILYIAFSMSLKSFIWLFTGNSKNISAIHKAFEDFFSNQMGKTEHNIFTDIVIRNKESN
jgi:GT2 family glycosyltransferase